MPKRLAATGLFLCAFTRANPPPPPNSESLARKRVRLNSVGLLGRKRAEEGNAGRDTLASQQTCPARPSTLPARVVLSPLLPGPRVSVRQSEAPRRGDDTRLRASPPARPPQEASHPALSLPLQGWAAGLGSGG